MIRLGQLSCIVIVDIVKEKYRPASLSTTKITFLLISEIYPIITNWNYLGFYRLLLCSNFRYNTLSNFDLFKLPVKSLSAPECMIALWCTNKPSQHTFITEKLLPAWGFVVVAKWYWIKVGNITNHWCAADFICDWQWLFITLRSWVISVSIKSQSLCSWYDVSISGVVCSLPTRRQLLIPLKRNFPNFPISASRKRQYRTVTLAAGLGRTYFVFGSSRVNDQRPLS